MNCENYEDGEADNTPFSIRQFVGATRRKDIFRCWPFPQKYLQICLKYGISNVLPPLEPFHPAIKITTETVGLTCSQQDKEYIVSFENKAGDLVVPEKVTEDECSSYYEMLKAPYHDCLNSHLDDSCTLKDESNLSSDYTSNVNTVQVNQQSSSAQGSDHLYVDQRINTAFPEWSGHKQRIRKGRQRKRSMVDILAKAKPRTLEDLYRISCNSINLTNDIVDESSGPMAHFEDIKDDDDDDKASNENFSSKKSRLLEIKFGGDISCKSWNID